MLMEKPWPARVTGAQPGDPPAYGSPSYKRTYAVMGYKNRERTKLCIFADNKTHARSITKKAGYEPLTIKLVTIR